MGQGCRVNRAAALADKQLEPGAAILGRAERDDAGREDRDVAAVASVIEDAKAPPVSGTEIERVLDDGAEPGGLDRERIVALIARGRSPIARVRVIVLVVGQPLAG